MKQEDIMKVQERFEDLSRTVNMLRHWIEDVQSACSSLKDDLDSLESECDDYASDCNDMDGEPDIPEGWEEVVELLPPKPSVGDVLALKELVTNWKRDTYGEL